MTEETKTPKVVDKSPKVVLEKEEMITIHIDPEMVTMQGIRVNDKLYIGEVTVSRSQAKDLLRIQQEYWETRKKLTDKTVKVRMKNDFQKEVLFLADPSQYEGNKNFSRDYGLLGMTEWGYCSPIFKEHLLHMRKQLYGY